jgi:hypothetical protein
LFGSFFKDIKNIEITLYRFFGSENVGEEVIVFALAVAPTLIYLGNPWAGELPFGGDQLSHLSQAYRFAAYWLSPIGSGSMTNQSTVDDLFRGYRENPLSWIYCRAILAVFIAAISMVVFTAGSRKACLLLFLTCVAWMVIDRADVFRWPSLFYFVSLPLLAVAEIAEWDNKLNALRLSSLLAIPAWLFILRPLFLGIRPNRWVIPFVIVFFWNHLVIRLYGSSYPDAWARVFVLTAFEVLLSDDRERFHKSLALVCIASLFKEPAIVFLPFCAMGGLKNNDVPRAGRILLAIATLLPFLVYFLVRTNMGGDLAGIDPAQGLRAWWPAWSLKAVAELADRYSVELRANLSSSQFVELIASLLILLWIWVKKKTLRGPSGSIVLAVCGIALFFLVDRSTGPNMRFALWAMVPLAVGVLFIRKLFGGSERKQALVIGVICALLIVSQGKLLFQKRKRWLRLIRPQILSSQKASQSTFRLTVYS